MAHLPAPSRFLLLLILLAGAAPASADVSAVRTLRLAGDLEAARSGALAALAGNEVDPSIEVALRLELARVEDRVGLHRNVRPVEEALRQIEVAAAVAGSPEDRAAVELARAEYWYRAEMGERAFPRATEHAERAAAGFRGLGDRHGEAEAVHRLGLVRMQRRELVEARELFERSLELDREGGERTFFRGEYERHVGFVVYLGGDVAGSIPYFDRSLAARREAGAVDASLFAAQTLGAVLVEVGRLDEALAPLLYAQLVAERLDSPVGRARTGLALIELYQARGEVDAARIAAERTLEAARAVGLESVEERAVRALERIDADSSRTP